MQLPQTSAHYSARVRFGQYVSRRLKRARLTAMAADVAKVTAAVLQAGRAAEDADAPVQDAMADRDAADDDLDVAAQTLRARLAGKSVEAVREEPYTRIFPDGIGFYLAAPLGEEIERYTLLAQRIEEHVPASEKVGAATVKAIRAGLTEFAAATKALGAAKNAAAHAEGRLESAVDAWSTHLEKTYGALVAEVGRTAAERFFPKGRTRAKKGSSGEGPAPAKGDAGD